MNFQTKTRKIQAVQFDGMLTCTEPLNIPEISQEFGAGFATIHQEGDLLPVYKGEWIGDYPLKTGIDKSTHRDLLMGYEG